VLTLLQAGDITVAEITAALFRPNLTSSQLHFAMAEMLAYLAYHKVRGRAARVRRQPDGVFVWQAVQNA